MKRTFARFLFIVAAAAPAHAASNCNRLAAEPWDVTRRAVGVVWEALDAQAAVPACESAVTAAPKDATSRYQLSRAYAKANRGAEALATLQEAATLGSAAAQRTLAERYESGEGLPSNPDKAIKLFERAVAGGDPIAAYTVGQRYLDNTRKPADQRRGLDLVQRAADRNYPDAVNRMGDLFEYGQTVQQNEKRAFQYFLKAAQLGSPIGRSNLARCYAEGRGTPVDLDKALQSYLEIEPFDEQIRAKIISVSSSMREIRPETRALLEKAAIYHADAQYVLGKLVCDGERARCGELYAKAAIGGSAAARGHLEILATSTFQLGREFVDPILAVSEAGADASPYAAYLAGAFHLHGHASSDKVQRALPLLNSAAARGYAPAQLMLQADFDKTLDLPFKAYLNGTPPAAVDVMAGQVLASAREHWGEDHEDAAYVAALAADLAAMGGDGQAEKYARAVLDNAAVKAGHATGLAQRAVHLLDSDARAPAAAPVPMAQPTNAEIAWERDFQGLFGWRVETMSTLANGAVALVLRVSEDWGTVGRGEGERPGFNTKHPNAPSWGDLAVSVGSYPDGQLILMPSEVPAGPHNWETAIYSDYDTVTWADARDSALGWTVTLRNSRISSAFRVKDGTFLIGDSGKLLSLGADGRMRFRRTPIWHHHLLILDEDGNQLWEGPMPLATFADDVVAVLPRHDDFVVIGQSWMVALTNNGAPVWAKSLPLKATAAAADGDGGILIGGSRSSDEDGRQQVVRLSPTGDLVWKSRVAATRGHGGAITQLLATPNGVVAALQTGQDWNNAASSISFVEVDRDGNERWRSPFSSGASDPRATRSFTGGMVFRPDAVHVALTTGVAGKYEAFAWLATLNSSGTLIGTPLSGLPEMSVDALLARIDGHFLLVGRKRLEGCVFAMIDPKGDVLAATRHGCKGEYDALALSPVGTDDFVLAASTHNSSADDGGAWIARFNWRPVVPEGREQ